LSKDNAVAVIINYVISLETGINPSGSYGKLNIIIMCGLYNFVDNKELFKQMTRDDILQYPEIPRKPEIPDPLNNELELTTSVEVAYYQLYLLI
jgi:hypothetical protein